MTLRMQVVPVEGFRLFGALVKKEIDLYRRKQGTFRRSGPKLKGRARWSHRAYKGWVNLERSAGEVVVIEVRGRQKNPADWQLLQALLGFVVRHFEHEIVSIQVQFPHMTN